MLRLMSTMEAAFAAGLHEQTVRRLIREGKLPAVTIGGKYRIDPRDLRLVIRPRNEVQRPAFLDKDTPR